MRVSNRSRRAEAVATLWIAREGSLISLATKARRQGTATPPKQDSSAPRSGALHLATRRTRAPASLRARLQDTKGISQLPRTSWRRRCSRPDHDCFVGRKRASTDSRTRRSRLVQSGSAGPNGHARIHAEAIGHAATPIYAASITTFSSPNQSGDRGRSMKRDSSSSSSRPAAWPASLENAATSSSRLSHHSSATPS